MGGGEPRRETMPCPSEGLGGYIGGVSYVRQRVLFFCFPDGSNRDLWLTGFDGSNPKSIGRYYLQQQSVSISPDLQTLLFSRKEGLITKPVDGGPERILARIDWPVPTDTFWHPSGASIGFFRVVDGVVKIWEVHSDGTGMRPMLPGFPAEQIQPQWSPDGRRLYFISKGDVYLKGSRGWLGWMRCPAPVRLTWGPLQFVTSFEDPANPLAAYAVGYTLQAALMKLSRKTNVWESFLGGLPAECIEFSPDGKWIVYVSWPDGGLWKCKRDGSGRVLLEDELFTNGPRWSPDGSRIAFSAKGRGTAASLYPFRIYTISASGGKPEQVPGVPGAAGVPTGPRMEGGSRSAPCGGRVAKRSGTSRL